MTVSGGWRKLAALVLAVAAVGLPINQIEAYALLLIAAVVIFNGEVRAGNGAWSAAAAIVVLAVAGQIFLAPPRIEEGHNVFLPSPTLERDLPAEVYRRLADEFDAQYPPGVRCKSGSVGCWQDGGFPDSAFAFSADGIWHKPVYSRSVTDLDFSDPVWLRLGFINENRYDWYSGTPDVHRADRDRRFWTGLHRWHLAMPWYEMIRLPAAYVGGELCWRGELMWEGEGEHFSRWIGDSCRTIEPADAGRRIFGIAIKPDTLAMQVAAPWTVRVQNIASAALAVIAVLAVTGVLVRFRIRHLLLPAILILLALLVIAIDDASFIGGVRPFDGGDDGLFYDGVGRLILQKLLAGDIAGFLEGGEKVFYYGGPGLRYFRALEHIVFGESLSWLSLAHPDASVHRPGPVPAILAGALVARADPFVYRGAVWCPVRHQFPAIPEMGVAGICRPRGVHFLLLCNSPAHRPNVFRPRKGWCYCVLWRASACFGDIHEADRGTRRRCACLAAPGLLHSLGGNGRDSLACASASCRYSRWPCTTGCMAMSLFCSAPIRKSPVFW